MVSRTIIFPLTVIGLTQCSQIGGSPFSSVNSEKRKDEIVAFSQMLIDDIAGEMYIRKLSEKVEGNALIYPAEMDNDYYKFFPTTPGKFIIAYENEDKYEAFFKSIENLKIDKIAINCPDGKVYQLGEECYVCKTGFKRGFQKYILVASKGVNFSLPATFSKTKPKKIIKPQPEPLVDIDKLSPLERSLYMQTLDKSKPTYRSNVPTRVTPKDPRIYHEDEKPSEATKKSKSVEEDGG